MAAGRVRVVGNKTNPAVRADVPASHSFIFKPGMPLKTTVSILGASLILSCASVGRASVIFSQDFSGSSTVSDYVSATPNSGQWNDIATTGSGVSLGIINGALQYGRTGNNTGSFTRSTDFSPAPTALIYSFDLTVSSVTAAASSVATWYAGSGFSSGASAPTSSSYNSRFAINFNSDGTFSLHVISGSTSSAFSSGNAVSLTWVVNDTGSSLSYLGPDGQTDTVGNGKWDLYAGSTLIFDEQTADGTSTSLTDLKFLFTANTGTGYGTISMDNFEIQAVPEPPEWGPISALGLMGICGLREWRQRRCGENLKSCPVK